MILFDGKNVVKNLNYYLIILKYTKITYQIINKYFVKQLIYLNRFL